MLGILGVIISVIGSFLVTLYNSSQNKKRNEENKEIQISLQKQQLDFQKEMTYKKNKNQKNEAIRKSFVVYLAELENCRTILGEFLDERGKLYLDTDMVADIIKSNGNPEMVIGYNAKQMIPVRQQKLGQLKEKWEVSLKNCQIYLQELLLHFKVEEEEKIDKILNSPMNTLFGLNWVFETNVPTEMIESMLCGNTLGNDIGNLRKEMRNILNN